MKLSELIAAKQAEVNQIKQRHEDHLARQRGIITTARSEGRDRLTPLEQSDFDASREAAQTEAARHEAALRSLDELQRAQADEDQIAADRAVTTPTGAGEAGTERAATIQVGREERTYAAHKERGFDQSTGRFRRGAKPGGDFERDVAAAFLGDYEAQERLRQHMQEERAERPEALSRHNSQARAAGTGAFSGLVVPQYLTDLYAPATSAKRPFADICNGHQLPEQGMTVNISRITTPTSVDEQATENTNVSEQDIDDTLLTLPVLTNAGRQTLSRQSIERGAGVEAIVMDDLFLRYSSKLDSQLLNRATHGLTNVATGITYTSGSPTVEAFLPLTSQAASAVETTLLDMASGETLALMHSRRWYWLNQAISTKFPLLNQPGVGSNQAGVNYAETYGQGFRGLLPNGVPVVVDNNIATNLGAGTNQDEAYTVDRRECHLWEDPQAPVFIRAEQPKAESLGVVLVLYGYYAFTHARYAHAQKIGGTGLTPPTWTGV